MTNHRQMIPISQKLFSLLEKLEEVGEVPCQSFPDLFFPEGTLRQIEEDTKAAKQMCQDCPLIDECRMYGLQAKEPFGIWGGFDPKDREQFLRTISSTRFRANRI